MFRGSRVNLNTYFASRGTIWRPLGVILGVLVPTCPILVPSWAAQKHSKRTPRGLQEASKRPLDESRHPKKTLFFPCFFDIFVFRGSRVNLRTYFARRGAIWRPLGVILGRLGTILGRPGAILGRLGVILGRLGAVLGSQNPPKNRSKRPPRRLPR